MLKKRVIAVILVRDGRVVQSVNFRHTNVIHYNPIHAIHSFNRWAIDEILVLNVSKTPDSKKEFSEVIQSISQECFVPLSAGGWVQTVEDARDLFQRGADKIVVNTMAFERPELITELALKYGNQAVVVSIDAKPNGKGVETVVVNRGERMTEMPVLDWARLAESKGAGELFVNSIPNDGARKGYNLPLMRAVKDAVRVPVIAMGGVLTWTHLAEGAEFMDAVAAANIFHYTEHSTKKAKQFLLEKGFNFRKV
jgi:imidazole glycerol-phosphate synthase subunit HisF